MSRSIEDWPSIAAGLAAALIVGVGGWLQFGAFPLEPVHADEATQAYLLDSVLQGKPFVYDPTHHHGPMPHWINAAWMRATGHRSWVSIDTWHLRLLPTVASCLGLGFLVFWAWRVTPWAGPLAAGLGVTSPILLHYSRVAIPESLFALFAILTAFSLFRAATTLRKRYWMLGGFCAALLAGTKETWIIVVLGCLAASLPLLIPSILHDARRGLVGGFLMLVVFLGVVLIIFTNGFSHPVGIRDFFAAYWIYETDPGHAKAWSYYITEILLPHGRGWGEPAVWLCVVAAGWWGYHRIFRRRGADWNLAQFCAMASLAQIAGYSVISYKTPWLMVVPVALAVPAAAIFLGFAIRRAPCPWRRWLLAILFLSLGGWGVMVREQTHRRFADFRNPLAYVPTSRQLPELTAYLEDAAPGERIAVVGTDYWPLPWYLRRLPDVGYYDVAPSDLSAFGVLLVVEPAVWSVRDAGWSEALWGLRSDVFIRSYVRERER